MKNLPFLPWLRRPFLLALTCLTVVPACADDADPPADNKPQPLGPVQTLTEDRLTAQVNETTDQLVLAKDGTAQLVVTAKDLALGRGAWKVDHSFGSFKFNADSQSDWLAGAQLELTGVWPEPAKGKAGIPRPNPQELQFRVLDAANQPLWTGKLYKEQQGFRLQLTAVDQTFRQSRMAYNLRPDAHIVGLGGQSFDVDHKGQRARLWVQEDGIGKNPVAEDDHTFWPLMGQRYTTHTPMPVYISSAGHAVVVHTDHCISVDLGKTTANQAEWVNEHPNLDLWWTAGDSLADNVTRLTAHLGRPQVPPLFAFGTWIDAIYGKDNVLRIANKLRQLQIPVSALWTEDWRGGKAKGTDYTLDEDWRADAELYPDIAGMIQTLQGLGYKFLTYNNTFLTQDADVWDESTKNGHAIAKQDGSVYAFNTAKFVPASLVDLTRPETFDWTKKRYKEGLDLGADGWMADFCEWLPTDAVLHAGTGWDWHQRYPVLCQQVNKALFDEVGKDGVERLFFVRSAWLGSQPLVSVVWAGDQQTDFSAGDGLVSVIPMGIGLGLTGFPFYGHDIAGYASVGTEVTSKELWWRWVSFGALSPVMRTHHGKLAKANWNWESDAATEQMLARWARIHMQLVPYLYRLAEQVPQTGLPLFGPLALQFPDFTPGWTRVDQYLLGDRIVVAPVVQASATSRTVELPAGSWYPLLGGPKLQSTGAGQVVDAPLSEIPAFVPAGSLLVLWPEGVQSTEPAGRNKGQRKPNDVQAAREVWLWPGQLDAAHAALGQWLDSGRSYDWQPGSWSGACQQATWNGQPASIVDGQLALQGSGTLVLDDAATLVVGGTTAAADKTQVRCAHLRPAPTPLQP